MHDEHPCQPTPAGRGGRRRSRRLGGGLRCKRARARRHALREERLARWQGGAPRDGRLPLRHGADDPHCASRARSYFRRGRQADVGLPRLASARSAMAVFFRWRRSHRPDGRRDRDGGRNGAFRAGSRRRRGATGNFSRSPSNFTKSANASSSGRRWKTCSIPSTCAPT